MPLFTKIPTSFHPVFVTCFAIDEKAPASTFRTTKKKCPASVSANRVSVLGAPETNSSYGHLFLPVRRHVNVAAFQHPNDKIPAMIMMMPRVVAAPPVMQPDREEAKVQHPAPQIGALRVAETLAEGEEGH